jgi:hypothetical protein
LQTELEEEEEKGMEMFMRQNTVSETETAEKGKLGMTTTTRRVNTGDLAHFW